MPIAILIIVIITTATLIAILLLLHNLRKRRQPTALVISLSPANHSPRALAHATSISHHIKTIFLAQPPFPNPTPSIVYQPLHTPSTPTTLLKKLISYSVTLTRALLHIIPQNVTTIIINTPPAIPTLPITLLLTRPFFPKATIIVDWHNLAYTLIPSSASSLTPLAKFIEFQSAHFAHIHWTVSRAMANHLHNTISIHPIVIYDTPRAHFITAARSITPHSRNLLFARLSKLATRIGPSHHPNHTNIIVTSTSWTPDEDFQILYDALVTIDKTNLSLIVVITGRGPLRDTFEQRFRQADFQNVAVWMAWLPIDDYPRLLAFATLGLSLHKSSSGLDLPMKAVDMLACGLPVLALRYDCIHELVKHAVNGFLFRDAPELAALLVRLLNNSNEIDRLRRGVEQSFDEDMQWETYWQRTALPTIPTLS